MLPWVMAVLWCFLDKWKAGILDKGKAGILDKGKAGILEKWWVVVVACGLGHSGLIPLPAA